MCIYGRNLIDLNHNHKYDLTHYKWVLFISTPLTVLFGQGE